MKSELDFSVPCLGECGIPSPLVPSAAQDGDGRGFVRDDDFIRFESAAKAGHAPTWMGPRGEAADAMARFVQAGDVVITIGAGDITQTGPELSKLLAR